MAFINKMQAPFFPNIPFMPAYPVLARAYVPYQTNFRIYQPEEGYHKGTLFPDLYRSYSGTMPSGREQ